MSAGVYSEHMARSLHGCVVAISILCLLSSSAGECRRRSAVEFVGSTFWRGKAEFSIRASILMFRVKCPILPVCVYGTESEVLISRTISLVLHCSSCKDIQLEIAWSQHKRRRWFSSSSWCTRLDPRTLLVLWGFRTANTPTNAMWFCQTLSPSFWDSKP